MKIETYEFIQDIENLRQELLKSDLDKINVNDSFLHVISEHFDIKLYCASEQSEFELNVRIKPYSFSKDVGVASSLGIIIYIRSASSAEEVVHFDSWMSHVHLNKLAEIPLVAKFIGKYAN